MRVVTYITEGYRELIEELERVPAKQRAERFRLLASIGLLTIRRAYGLTGSEASQLDRETAGDTIDRPPSDARRAKLRSKLQSSLKDDSS